MSTTTEHKIIKREWVGPDLGGAYWLEGIDINNQAVVCEDPTGETSLILWSVIIDEYANDVARGLAVSIDYAMEMAQAALEAYEGSKQ